MAVLTRAGACRRPLPSRAACLLPDEQPLPPASPARQNTRGQFVQHHELARYVVLNLVRAPHPQGGDVCLVELPGDHGLLRTGSVEPLPPKESTGCLVGTGVGADAAWE